MVVDFMDDNLHRRLSLSELAGIAGISRCHLCRLFKTETGMPPGQYLEEIRMQKASRLLTATLLSIKQILYEVGYTDKSLFGRHFRKARGCTPSEYRAKYHHLILANDHTVRQKRNVT